MWGIKFLWALLRDVGDQLFGWVFFFVVGRLVEDDQFVA